MSAQGVWDLLHVYAGGREFSVRAAKKTTLKVQTGSWGDCRRRADITKQAERTGRPLKMDEECHVSGG